MERVNPSPRRNPLKELFNKFITIIRLSWTLKLFYNNLALWICAEFNLPNNQFSFQELGVWKGSIHLRLMRCFSLLSKSDSNLIMIFSPVLKITLLGDYNINYLDSKEKENLDSIIIPYGLKVFYPNDETRISSSSKTHIDYIISDYETNGIEFCFDTPYKTDHFASIILTDIKCGKSFPRITSTFNMKNYQKNEFCNTLSALPWYLLYQCTDAQNMFSAMI